MEHSSYLRSNESAISVKKQKRIFKIIVIGDSSVGKTCLTHRFCGGEFPTKTEATIGMDFREREVMIDDEKIKLQLWDTAGQERFRKSMVPHYYRNVHAVVFVYDVTKIASFRNLSAWIEECDENRMSSDDVARILVGNKCDCKDGKAVNTSIAQKFADMYQMPLFETSAKDDAEADHIEAIFLTLAHKLKSSKPLMSRTGSQYGRPESGIVELSRSSENDAKTKNDDSWCCLFN